MFKNCSDENLLVNNPDGIGKHVFLKRLTPPWTLTPQERVGITDRFELGELPFFLDAKGERYLVILGGDFTLIDRWNTTTPASNVPTIQECVDLLNGRLKWYLDLLFGLMGVDRESVAIHLIGRS